MVQARAVIGVTDVHPRPLAYGVEALQDLDGFRAVPLCAICLFGVPSGMAIVVAAIVLAHSYASFAGIFRRREGYTRRSFKARKKRSLVIGK
jgi:hypothetical protein